MSVGVRELRDGLSKHLAMVREGHTVTVTDHGRPVARIIPVDGQSALERLISEGKVTPRRRKERTRPSPVQTEGTVSDLIDHQRR